MIPTTSHKAWVAAAVGFVGPILTWLTTWMATGDPWSWRPFLAAVIGSAVASLATGGATWAVPNLPITVGDHAANRPTTTGREV